MSAQVAFGRRGGPPRPAPAGQADEVAGAPPSAIREDLAAAARAAFKAPKSKQPSVEPPVSAGPSPPLDEEEAMRAFVGPNWRAYKALWDKDRARPRMRSSFGLGPALFGATWLIYRKRWLVGFLVLAAEAATAYLAPLFALLLSVLLRAVVGRYGKSLILKAGASAVAREVNGDGATFVRLQRLRKAGGVNLWLPILLVLAETWLAVNRMQAPHSVGFDPVDLLDSMQRALP